MKKNLLIALLLTATTLVSAQFRPNSDREWHRTEQDEKKFSFGYYLGVNVMSYKISPKSQNNNVEGATPDDDGVDQNGKFYVEQETKPGFSVGLIGKLRINDHFSLKTEPGVHFTSRTLLFDTVRGNEQKDIVSREVKSAYVDIPLLINYSGDRWFNTRPYIQTGFGYAYNLQSNENKEDDNHAGIFRTTSNNFNWQAEMGIEIYFKRFKLTPSLKGMFFLNNELVPDKDGTTGYANTLNSLKTRAVVFSLKFE